MTWLQNSHQCLVRGFRLLSGEAEITHKKNIGLKSDHLFHSCCCLVVRLKFYMCLVAGFIIIYSIDLPLNTRLRLSLRRIKARFSHSDYAFVILKFVYYSKSPYCVPIYIYILCPKSYLHVPTSSSSISKA